MADFNPFTGKLHALKDITVSLLTVDDGGAGKVKADGSQSDVPGEFHGSKDVTGFIHLAAAGSPHRGENDVFGLG